MNNKTLILTLSLLLVGITNGVAQSWQTYDFNADGLPLTMSFPKQPSRNIEQKESKTYTYMATEADVTYVAQATQSNKTLPASVAENSLKNILGKAKETSSQGDYTLNGYGGKQAKYTSAKGAFVDIRLVTVGNTLYQFMVISMKAYPKNTDNFFKTAQFGQNSSNNSSNNSNSNSNNSSNNNSSSNNSNSNTNSNNNNTPSSGVGGLFQVGDRIEAKSFDKVRNQDRWDSGVILKVQADGYYINYDFYAENYNETVPADRLRKMNLNIDGKVQYIPAKKGQTITVKGNLSQGEILEDLEWAESSSNACWVGIRNVEFEGNHVFYWFDLPKKSITNITVTPKNKERINVYGFVSFDFKHYPPNLPQCISCEAGFQQWISTNMPDFTKSAGPQSIELNAVGSRMLVFVAVAGAKGFTKGDYELKIEIK
jgi:hypothetical protein